MKTPEQIRLKMLAIIEMLKDQKFVKSRLIAQLKILEWVLEMENKNE